MILLIVAVVPLFGLIAVLQYSGAWRQARCSRCLVAH